MEYYPIKLTFCNPGSPWHYTISEFLSLTLTGRNGTSASDSDTIDIMDSEEEGIGIGLDTACSEIEGVSSVDSIAVTNTKGAGVIFSLLEADNGDKITETSLDSNFFGTDTSSAKNKLCKEESDVKLPDSTEEEI